MDEITLNGFEVFEDFLPGANVQKKENKSNEISDELEGGASEELTDEELEALRNPNPKKEEKEEKEEEEPIDDPKDDKAGKSKVEDKKEEEPDPDEHEEDDNTVSAFFGVMAEKMGWEMDEDDEIPSTPEELVDYFQAVIEENSVPQYASEEVEALDKFVKNGGNLRDYFEIGGELDLDEINIEDDEANQKMILKEFLKEKGFNSKQIDKKISKYEDAGLLEDEATDALEALRDIKEQKKQQLLIDQEKQAREAEKRQQAYFNSVVNEIKGMDNIRGIKIPEKDKKALLEYIFKPDAEGKTQYQRDWSKSVKNLLESAYFTMKGDTLLKAAKNEGSTDAINKFKNSLNKTGVSRRTKKTDNSTTDMWKSFVQQLRN